MASADQTTAECPDRLRLAEELSRATEAVRVASSGDRYRLDYLTEVAEALNEQRRAEMALERHRKEHGC
jgi:hypothetical protein